MPDKCSRGPEVAKGGDPPPPTMLTLQQRAQSVPTSASLPCGLTE